MALMIAEVNPLCSNSLIPLMVIPPEWLLRSISTLGGCRCSESVRRLPLTDWAIICMASLGRSPISDSGLHGCLNVFQYRKRCRRVSAVVAAILSSGISITVPHLAGTNRDAEVVLFIIRVAMRNKRHTFQFADGGVRNQAGTWHSGAITNEPVLQNRCRQLRRWVSVCFFSFQPRMTDSIKPRLYSARMTTPAPVAVSIAVGDGDAGNSFQFLVFLHWDWIHNDIRIVYQTSLLGPRAIEPPMFLCNW